MKQKIEKSLEKIYLKWNTSQHNKNSNSVLRENRDYSCVACAKCFKVGSFERYESLEVVGFTGCGECPGLVVPKMKLFHTCLQSLDRDYEVLFVGTCVKAAMETGNCPIWTS